MMIDGQGILIALGVLAGIGFIGGAIASIWLGPAAMLWGALGVPVAVIVLVIVALLLGKVQS